MPPTPEKDKTVDIQVSYDRTTLAVKAKTISRYELAGRQIIIYLEEFTSAKPVMIQYHLQAKFPLRVKTPSSTTYNYYNPGVTGTQAPLQLTVQ